MTTQRNAAQAGEPANLAAFGKLRWWRGTQKQDLQTYAIDPEPDGTLRPVRDAQSGEWSLGVEWDEARDIRRVIVDYAGAVPPGLKVQYWRFNWPTMAPERLPGARRGWIGRDDPFHGEWVTVKAEKTCQGTTCTFDFDPIDLPELGGHDRGQRLEQARDYLARFRQTLKVRLVNTGDAAPVIQRLAIQSRARWVEGQVDVCFPQDADETWSGRADVRNGCLLAAETLEGRPGAPDGRWQCEAGRTPGVRLTLLLTDAGADSNDRTIVTLWTGARSFSFQPADLHDGPIYLPDAGVFIAWTGSAIDLATWQAELERRPRSILDRVAAEPEQSLSRVLAEIPPLDPTIQRSRGDMGLYLPIGVPAGRQEWAIRWNGELFADKVSLKLTGRDAAHLIWPGCQLRYRFGTGDPADFHERRGAVSQSVLDGWLPIVVSRWEDREFSFEQTAFAALLDGPLTPEIERRGDENIVAMLRFVIRNTTHGRKRTRLLMAVHPQEEWELRDGRVVATGRVVPAGPVKRQWRVEPYDEPVLRCTIDGRGRGRLSAAGCGIAPRAMPPPDRPGPSAPGEPGASEAIPTAVAYDIELEGGESHTLTMTFPFVSFSEAADWDWVAALDLEEKLADVAAFWRGLVLAGGQMETPEPLLNDLHKAIRTHVAISIDKDPPTGWLSAPAATYDYGVCANEACWQITMLDQAGHHAWAERCLETFLATQGMSHLDGNFQTRAGLMQGLDIDDGTPHRSGFAYNLDPGFIMETLALHWQLTGDRGWLERVASRLVEACDFMIRERAATQRMEDGPGGERPAAEYGLLPAGHLEDNPEWRHWFAVNAHAYGGLQRIAAALADIGHPEAERLAQEAAAYRADIRRAAHRAMVEAPVVRLLDGAYIPRIPTRTGMRGREEGWFREAAYGALHLCESGVYDPCEQEMGWVLRDLEDNLFISREWGRPVDLERCWFSQGGVTIQANLMDLAIDYLRRGDVKAGLRSLFNNFGASTYTDVRCFTEHPVIELGHGIGPHYKVSDESKALVWLRAFLLREEGQTLHLTPGAPRAWFAAGQPAWGVQQMASAFGPVSYRIHPDAAGITVEIQPQWRQAPAELCLHLRTPEGVSLRSVTVNGSAADYDTAAELVRLAHPSGPFTIRAE